MRITLVMLFILISNSIFSQAQDTLDELSFITLETMPKYPGGNIALFKYFTDNLNVRDPGKVIVRFTIDEHGNVMDSEILQGISRTINQEIIKLVEQMPRWKPGMKSQVPIKVVYTLPLQFCL